MYDLGDGLCRKGNDFQYCTAFRGGIFPRSGSNTFSAATDLVSAGGVHGDTDNVRFQVGLAAGGSDTLDLGSNTMLSKFPLGFPRKDWRGGVFPMNSLGLGLNSTLLSSLRAAGKIGSRSFSLYYGSPGGMGATSQDGSLILGGYDAAKTVGKRVQKSIGPRTATCPTGLLITANDIQLNFLNGKNATITPAATIDFCIVPSFPGLMSLPVDPFFNVFESLTGTKKIGTSAGVNFGSALYTTDTAYVSLPLLSPRQFSADSSISFKGNITLTLSSNLTITIPTSQLLVPEQTLNANGTTKHSTTISSLLITPLGKNNPLPIMLGRQFLTSVYLSVNQDENTFSLWAANPTSLTSIVPINHLGCFTPAKRDHPDDHTTAGNPRTAIVGIVVSSFLFISLAIVSLVMCVRVKKRKAQEAEEAEEAKRMSFMDRGIEGDAREISGDIGEREFGLVKSEGGELEETKFDTWAGEADAYEMNAPVASWTPLGQQRSSILPPVDGVGGWPLNKKNGPVAELPPG
jgi:hypothetical protein